MGNCSGRSSEKKVIPGASKEDEGNSNGNNEDNASTHSKLHVESPRLSRMPTQLRSIDPHCEESGKTEMKQSESNYWSDLNASLKMGSWKDMQISALVGRQFSGGMHRVPSHGTKEKKDKK